MQSSATRFTGNDYGYGETAFAAQTSPQYDGTLRDGMNLYGHRDNAAPSSQHDPYLIPLTNAEIDRIIAEVIFRSTQKNLKFLTTKLQEFETDIQRHLRRSRNSDNVVESGGVLFNNGVNEFEVLREFRDQMDPHDKCKLDLISLTQNGRNEVRWFYSLLLDMVLGKQIVIHKTNYEYDRGGREDKYVQNAQKKLLEIIKDFYLRNCTEGHGKIL